MEVVDALQLTFPLKYDGLSLQLVIRATYDDDLWNPNLMSALNDRPPYRCVEMMARAHGRQASIPRNNGAQYNRLGLDLSQYR
jgi:hypothetical protein